MGTDSDIGRIIIGKVYATNLINLKKPFKCGAEIQRVDAHIDLGEPDYYIGREKDGSEYYYDNSIAKAGSAFVSSFFDQLSRRPYSDHINIYPTNDGRYQMQEKINGETQLITFSARNKK